MNETSVRRGRKGYSGHSTRMGEFLARQGSLHSLGLFLEWVRKSCMYTCSQEGQRRAVCVCVVEGAG